MHTSTLCPLLFSTLPERQKILFFQISPDLFFCSSRQRSLIRLRDFSFLTASFTQRFCSTRTHGSVDTRRPSNIHRPHEMRLRNLHKTNCAQNTRRILSAKLESASHTKEKLNLKHEPVWNRGSQLECLHQKGFSGLLEPTVTVANAFCCSNKSGTTNMSFFAK